MSIKLLRERADRLWSVFPAVVLRRFSHALSVMPAEIASFVQKLIASDKLAAYAFITGMLQNAVRDAGGDIDEISLIQEWFLLRWRQTGYPTFSLTESLYAALQLTDYKNTTMADWQPAFDPVALALPRPLRYLDGKIMRESSLIFVGSVPALAPEHKHVLDFTTLGEQLNAIATVEEKASTALRRTFVELIPNAVIGQQIWSFFNTPRSDDAESFGQWFARVRQHTLDSEELEELDKHALDAAVRIAMGLWQYLNHELAPQKSGESVEQRFAAYQEGKVRTYRVGREIKLDAPSEVLRTIGTVGWKVHSRFMVRRHEHGYRVGEGRAGIVRKWVGPYWKGPQNAQQVLDRSYCVDNFKKEK